MDRKSGGISESAEREIKELDSHAFEALFRDACRKCFSSALIAPLTETESHRLSVEIAESTGLEIGWKSLKNYSQFLFGKTTRAENPSVPTLDTLARYVAGAPPTDEERRRTRERHYPYWFRYRDALRPAAPEQTADGTDEVREEIPEASDTPSPDPSTPTPSSGRRTALLAFAVVVGLAVAVALPLIAGRRHSAGSAPFTDEFEDIAAPTLATHGWSVQSLDSAHWAQRGTKSGHLTLFTLEGDNWPQPQQEPVIRNLLVRRLPSECFVVDVRLTAFFPQQNWQQAGILLLEDTTFAGRSARLSIGYNDFSGGFPQTREVIVQAITSLGRSSGKPEEIVHRRLFEVNPATEALVRQNLESSALRIEKRGAHLRLLYSAGPLKNGAFREVGRTDFDFRPTIVALFAIKGFVSQSEVVPVHIDAFSQAEVACTP
jgi:hypothetical protein